MEFTVKLIWVLGATLAIIVLLLAIAVLIGIALRYWRKGLSSLHIHLWVYQALLAYQRSGHPRPDGGTTMGAHEKLRLAANALVDAARAEGYIVTIEMQALAPLAMGRAAMVVGVREAPTRYRKSTAP